MIRQISKNVRIITLLDPFKVSHDVIVEVLKDGEWTFYQGFNSLSDDYAMTNARESAMTLEKRLTFAGTPV
jgi:hypothetical protein